MKLLTGATALLIAWTGTSAAAQLYDRKLEQAAMAVIARKIGDIRATTFDDYAPQLAFRRFETPKMTAARKPAAKSHGKQVVRQDAQKKPADWQIAAPRAAGDSITVGSIQTYGSPQDGGAASIRSRKMPRIIKF